MQLKMYHYKPTPFRKRGLGLTYLEIDEAGSYDDIAKFIYDIMDRDEAQGTHSVVVESDVGILLPGADENRLGDVFYFKDDVDELCFKLAFGARIIS